MSDSHPALPGLRPTPRSAPRAAPPCHRGPRSLHPVSRRYGRNSGFHTAEHDLLVAESSNQLQVPAQRRYVPLKGRYLAVAKLLSAFESRNVCLVHLRLGSDFNLCLSGRLAQRSHREAHATLGSKAASEHAYGLRLRRKMSLCQNAHVRPPVSHDTLSEEARQRSYRLNLDEARRRLAAQDLERALEAARRAQAVEPSGTEVLNLLEGLEARLASAEAAPTVLSVPDGETVISASAPTPCPTAVVIQVRTRGAAAYRDLGTFGDATYHRERVAQLIQL